MCGKTSFLGQTGVYHRSQNFFWVPPKFFALGFLPQKGRGPSFFFTPILWEVSPKRLTFFKIGCSHGWGHLRSFRGWGSPNFFPPPLGFWASGLLIEWPLIFPLIRKFPGFCRGGSPLGAFQTGGRPFFPPLGGLIFGWQGFFLCLLRTRYGASYRFLADYLFRTT